MSLKVFRNEILWLELPGNRFHQLDLVMIESMILQTIYNNDEDYGCSDEELDSNQDELNALFDKFSRNRKRYLDKLNNFLQSYHLEIVIDKDPEGKETKEE